MVHVAAKIDHSTLNFSECGGYFETFKFCSENGRLAVLVVFSVLRHLEYLDSETCTLVSLEHPE